MPKGVVVKKGRPASKGPIKATIEAIKGEPGGYHLSNTRNFQTMELPTTTKGIIKIKSINNDFDYESEQNMQQDFEGQRFLEFKSISGMDLVPRIRQPTPEKKEVEPLTPTGCDGCQRY